MVNFLRIPLMELVLELVKGFLSRTMFLNDARLLGKCSLYNPTS